MGTSKLIFSIGLIGLLLNSCKQEKPTSDMGLDELRYECDMLRQDKAMALENNIEAQEIIDNIFASLNSLSGRTATLERSLEDNSVFDNRSKAEEIARDIVAIKQKLDDAAELENIDKSTKIIISKLKDTIEQKEREVDELKELIRQKDEEISNLDQQVSSLDEELGQTSQQLRESNTQLAEAREELRKTEIGAWINMGDELISAAKEMDKTEKGEYKEIKGNFNYKRIKKAQLAIIREAIACYQKAQQLGSTVASSRITEANQLLRHKEQI